MIKIGVVMGSISDWETMQHTCLVLDELDILYVKDVISAHRTPDEMFHFSETAKGQGLEVIIAGAGGAAHLPGMIAAKTTLPVIGVPMQTRGLGGKDSLLSIVQMPAGVPTATMTIGKPGAVNAGLFAAQILALKDENIAQRLDNFRRGMQGNVEEMRDELAKK